MRPPVLNPLFATVSALPGIGPKLEKLFQRLIGREGEPPRLIDLLFHMPTGFVDRRLQPAWLRPLYDRVFLRNAVHLGKDCHYLDKIAALGIWLRGNRLSPPAASRAASGWSPT